MKTFLAWIFGIAFFFLLAMTYWSSVLVEKDLKALRSDLRDLKNDIQKLRFQSGPGKAAAAEPRSQMSDLYPNLLEEDPYFAKTLPDMLGPNFVPEGTRREAILGRPENLHPFNPFRNVSDMVSMCSVSVAQLQFGKYETMAPNMALKLEARPIAGETDVHEYWVHLRDGVYWHPLDPRHFPDSLKLASHFFDNHQVTAHDFKFYYDAVMNPSVSEAKAASLKNYYNDIEEFRIIDDLTFVIRWKRQEGKVKYTAQSLTGALQPLPRFVFQYFADGKKIIEEDDDPETYRHNSVWAQNFSQHFAKNTIVSCGPWLFDGMTDEGISFRRNPDSFEPYAVLVEKLHYTFKESHDAIWQDFKAGKLDLTTLAPNQMPELEQFLASDSYKNQKSKGLAIKELDYVDLVYYYIGWNQATPYFSNLQTRQAMTMAIDRNRIIEQNLNQMGVAITGPFFRYSPAYDPSIEAWPYNPDEARRLLDEEGWIDMDGDGIRDKIVNGERIPFRFTLVYYSKNVSTRVICEYIATALREVGVDCRLRGLDITDLSRSFEDKTFDAIYMGWGLGAPPEDPRQLWHSAGAKEKGSSNAVGFANPQADALIEELLYEDRHDKRIELYHSFHKEIHDSVPYTFLYSPMHRLLYRDYVKNLFIPLDRQDLVPGANISEPDFRVIWLSSKQPAEYHPQP